MSRRSDNPLSAADRARRARSKRRALGLKQHRGKQVSLFDRGVFVAIDGEGFNEGPEQTWKVGVNETEYHGREHFYGYLAASDGSELYTASGRLTTPDCLDFILSIKQHERRAILVCFGASYDFTQILAFSLCRDDLRLLLQGDGRKFSRRYVDVSFGQYDYRLECRPRKSLQISRWPLGANKYERHTNRHNVTAWRRTACESATLWDVWGFFQGSFLAALDNWLPGDADYQFIKDWKGKRGGFQRSELDTIRRYNAAELRCLVTMMDKVRVAIAGMGLKITRWDGAGAIAGALFKHYAVKEHMAACPPAVFEAARHAYSGGHIENYKLGHHNGKVYHYDINSAYPHHFRALPSLVGGTWLSGVGIPPAGFTVIRLRFRFARGLPFYPLFYRESNGTILYPQHGEGWYWYPEYAVARDFYSQFGGSDFAVIEWHHLQGSGALSNGRTFAWVEDLYERRKYLVNEAKQTGVPNGEEKTLKLGYNSCYGKTAQQVGARYADGNIVPPPYFQIEWAGYVTSGCRAQIMAAAMQNPNAIISVATDGIFSTAPLQVSASLEKQLGAWEAQEHDGMTIVMPGVYWLHDGPQTKHYSRGFAKEDIQEIDFVMQGWQRGQDHVRVKISRLITLGSALASDSFWQMRGMFVEFRKELAINGDNSKRSPVTQLRKRKPQSGLVDTHPRDPWSYFYETPISAPYPIAWLDVEPEDETTADRQLNDDVLAAFLA